MTELEQYLSGDKARADIRAAIARCEANADDNAEHRCMVVGPGGPGFPAAWFTVSVDDAYVRGGDKVQVYYRADGDRFIVSDIGEGVRALQLRTGLMNLDAPLIVGEVRKAGAGQWGGMIAALIASAADLPDTICRVLLAAYKTAILYSDATSTEAPACIPPRTTCPKS